MTLAPTFPLVERSIGRPLRLAEQAIDVIRLTTALEQTKNAVDEAIRDEMIRAGLAWLEGRTVEPTLFVTEAMLAPLNALRDLGREEALAELRRAGYDPRPPASARAYASADPSPGRTRDLFAYLARHLPRLRVELERDLLHLTIGETAAFVAEVEVRRAILAIPGARDIASRIVSTALIDGLADTWENNRDVVAGWEYTAILDANTCEECEPLDGTQYETWNEAMVDLPDGGPNPRCLGEGRCRCRLVPL